VDRLQAHREFFAKLVTSSVGGANHPRLAGAFASTPRENFVGPGPWKVFAGGAYVETPSDDPAFLYQDVVVSISAERGINNGQPVLHAISLAALNIQEGETVLHIGAGTGYYTAILAKLTGPNGSVVAYEIEPDLAQRAKENLASLANISVRCESGTSGKLPECDAIYVSAGATTPLDVWLDALRAGGRLLFPLTSSGGPNGSGPGAMLLIERVAAEQYDASFICGAAFIPCAGARDEETAAKLLAAFQRGDSRKVKSLRRGTLPDETCWCAGSNWWLSTK
jgi:protein-L-isoaspartate(D-aspartate) O-methyltransferase